MLQARVDTVRLGLTSALAAVALGCLAVAVPGAYASFPGGNGVIAYQHQGPRGESEIWAVDPGTSDKYRLTRVSGRCHDSSKWEDQTPSFGVLGLQVVYDHEDSCDPSRQNGIYAASTDTVGRSLIMPAGYGGIDALAQPTVSPSNRLLAFVDLNRERVLISSFPRPAQPLQAVEDFPRYDLVESPTWGANGRLALKVASHGGSGIGTTGHIATVGRNGKGLRLVTRSSRDDEPDWAPTARQIAFRRETPSSNRQGQEFRGNVLVAPASGQSRPRKLTLTSDAWSPAWSPDGRFIAYVRARARSNQKGKLYKGSLWIMRASDGGGQRRLATDVIANRISWQPLP